MAELSDNSNWFETDASNQTPPPNGWPEGQMPSTVNDCARAMMGALKRWWDRTNPTQTITPSGTVWQYNTSNVSYPQSYVQGEVYSFLANGPAVGGDQIQINTLGAKPVYKATSGGFAAAAAHDWIGGQAPRFIYLGSLNASAGGFLLLDQPYVPISADSSGNVTFGGNLTVGGTSVFGGNANFDNGLLVSGGNLVSNVPADLNSTLSVQSTADIYDALTLHRTGTALTLTSGGASIAGPLSVGGGATFTGGIVVSGGGGSSIAGGLLVSSGGLSVNGTLTANNSAQVAGGLTVASGGLTISAGSLNVSDNATISQNLTVAGGGNLAGGNVAIGNNGIAYFGNTDQIGFHWDGTNLQAYQNRTAIGPLLLSSGSSPTFGATHVTGNLTVDGTTNFTANGVNMAGGLNITGGGLAVTGATSLGGQLVSNAGSTQAILANNGGIWSVGNVTAYNGAVALLQHGLSYNGGNQFGFTWASASGVPGAIAVYIDGVNEGYALFSGDIVYVERNTLSGGPTNQALDFFDGGGTTYRCFVDAVSDERLKTDIRDTQVDALAAVLATPVRQFGWTKAAREIFGFDHIDIGLVAQEAQVHMPGIASALAGQRNPKLPADLQYVNHDAAVPYLIRAIQQLEARLAQVEHG